LCERCLLSIGVNGAEILGNAGADPEGLVGGGGWNEDRGIPLLRERPGEAAVGKMIFFLFKWRFVA